MVEPMRIEDVVHGSSAYHEAVALRLEILRRPLGLAFTAEQLAAERASHHLACYRGERMVGCLMLTPIDVRRVQMRQVAVAADCRRQGLGRALVEASEALARRLGFTEMMLHARETAVPFYERLGYRGQGERFIEVTVPHWEMVKHL